MRELCIEEIAMSTRVALPMFLGCRMSELRRHLVPSPPSPSQDQQAQQVRRNLFGPIDHDENLKFVQNELTKIAQSDCKKWNFDFEAEKPQEGRFNWEPVVEGVPQAYEMPRLNYLSSNNRGTKTTPHTATSSSNIVSPSSSSSTTTSSTSSVSPSSAPCVPECSTTTPTAAAPPIIISTITTRTTTSVATSSTSDKPTFTKTSIPTQPSCSTDTKSSSEIVVVRPKQCNNNTSDLTLETKDRRDHNNTKSLPSVRNRTKSSQPPLTAFMKIRKSKRAANTKLEDDQPPALVKRSKTTTS